VEAPDDCTEKEVSFIAKMKTMASDVIAKQVRPRLCDTTQRKCVRQALSIL